MKATVTSDDQLSLAGRPADPVLVGVPPGTVEGGLPRPRSRPHALVLRYDPMDALAIVAGGGAGRERAGGRGVPAAAPLAAPAQPQPVSQPGVRAGPGQAAEHREDVHLTSLLASEVPHHWLSFIPCL